MLLLFSPVTITNITDKQDIFGLNIYCQYIHLQSIFFLFSQCFNNFSFGVCFVCYWTYTSRVESQNFFFFLLWLAYCYFILKAINIVSMAPRIKGIHEWTNVGTDTDHFYHCFPSCLLLSMFVVKFCGSRGRGGELQPAFVSDNGCKVPGCSATEKDELSASAIFSPGANRLRHVPRPPDSSALIPR